MEPNSQDKLAELIHRELMSLPEHRAPEHLMARVLARIEQQKRRWWQRPWAGWPFAARAISMTLMVLCAAAFVLGLGELSETRLSEWTLAQTAALGRPLAPVFNMSATLGNALLVSMPLLALHWWLLGGAVVFLMYVSCVALGTMCFRVAVRKG